MSNILFIYILYYNMCVCDRKPKDRNDPGRNDPGPKKLKVEKNQVEMVLGRNDLLPKRL